MELMYRTHGVDDITTEASRNNIRYQRMFSGAFMYAAGEHIGVEYGSTAPLVQGIPAGSAGFGEESFMVKNHDPVVVRIPVWMGNCTRDRP